MSQRRQRSLLLVLVLLLAGGGGAGAWWLSRQRPALQDAGLSQAPRPGVAPALEPRPQEHPALVRPDSGRRSAGPAATTVAHPLVLELTQLERGTFENVEGVLPVGSGANARLVGRVLGDDGLGVPSTVTFMAGPNEGRVLQTDSQGEFGASDLYQGLSVVLVETGRGVTSEREIMLRQLSQSDLNLTLGREAASIVRGTVRDPMGEPLEGAEVRLDGGTALTDPNGEFAFPRVSPGVRVLAVVKKKGYAMYRETVPIPRGTVLPADKLVFTLHPGADLELTVQAAVGSAGPSTAFILPIGGQRVNSVMGQSTFPWHLVNPVTIHPGGTALIEGLPEGHVNLTVFHPGALASPPMTNLKLLPGRVNHYAFQLRPAPSLKGVVKGPEGEPLAGALLVLESPHRSVATVKSLQRKPTFNLELVLPHLPSALQRVETDRRGRFALSLFPEIDSTYYLTAISRDGSLRANRVVEAKEAELELVLEPAVQAQGELAVGLAGRFQGLPVRVVINGAPRDEFVLRPEEELLVEALEIGTWRADARWHREELLRGGQLRVSVRDPARLDLVLPRGALEGPGAEEAVDPDDALPER